MDRPRPVKKRVFRPVRSLQWIILRAMMGTVAFVVEKRLLKALKRGPKPVPGAEVQAGEQDLSAAV